MTELQNHELSAERWRQTSSERIQQERQSKRNKRYRKVPVKVTNQPEKKRGVYMGRVTYEWKSGPNRGQKTSVPITLKTRAKLTIRGKDVLVKPVDGEAYVWGEKEGEQEPGTDSKGKPIRKSPSGKKREKRLRDQLKEKYDALIADRGPLEAGKAMAKGFVQAHNKLKGKTSKRALAKVYGVVLKSNKAAHRSFGRSVKNARSMTKKKPVEGSMPKIKKGDLVQHVLTDATFRVKKLKGKEAVVETENYLGTEQEAVFPIEDLQLKPDKPEIMAVVTALRAAADALDPPHTLMGHVIDAKKVTFDDDKYAALPHFPKVQDLLYTHRDQALGTHRGVRLDIPSSNHKGIVVVTFHEKGSGGTVIGYDHSAVIKNARFHIVPGAAKAVASGQRTKEPFSFVRGTVAGTGTAGQKAEPSGIPVYYDPQVAHLYVDARNGRPLKAAGEVNFYYKSGGSYYLPEIDGIYIRAKSPSYYGPGEAPGADPSGAWGWVQDTPFKKTGEPSKVVMP